MFERLFSIAKPKPSHFDLMHAGVAYKVTLKRAAAARRFTLRVRSASRDVVLTVPVRSSLVAAREFAERHLDWIQNRLAQLPQQVLLLPGARVPVRGVDHLIVHRPGFRKTVWIEANQSSGLADAAMLLCVTGEAEHIERRVRDYLKRQARTDIEAAVRHHTRTIGKVASNVTLRDTTSRWGSCTSRGSLNFSWRLILAPGYVLDYLAAHEVAHLVHMNHSAQFWELTAKLAPGWSRAEAWLKSQGAALHRFDN